MIMKIIITGASGLLGREILKIWKQSPHQVYGWSYSQKGEFLESIDLNNHQLVEQKIKSLQPDLIIHAAAERRPNICSEHPDQAISLNVEATKNLAELSQKHKFQLLYISTDYVFDGTTPPYSVHDKPNPLNFYGKSKLMGEKEILKSEFGSVLRVPILYGPCQELSESAVTIIANQLSSGVRQFDNWAIRMPTFTTSVAQFTRGWETPKLGIYHFCNHEKMTKYQIAQKIAKLLAIDKSELIPINLPTDTTPRPYDCELTVDNKQYNQDFAENLQKIIFSHL